MITYFSDLDGVITDSAVGLHQCFADAFRALGVEDLDEVQLDRYLGVPLPVAFRDVLPSLADGEVDFGIRAFRSAYEIYGIPGNRLYDGVESMLRAIAARSSGVWLVTTKPQGFAERVVEHLGIGWSIAGVVGAGLDERDTKTGLVAAALERAAADPARTLMLGDRDLDVEGALANDVFTVGALWGYGGKDELEAAGCTAFAHTPREFEDEYVTTMTPEVLDLLRGAR